MTKGFTLALVLVAGGGLLTAAEHDYDAVVSWRSIVGVTTAPGIDNPVAVTIDNRNNVVSQIHSGTLPWVTRSGSASVDLTTGGVRFAVKGLVLNGGNATGTAGPINQVIGTLVCNPGSVDTRQPQAVVDTPPVVLSSLGNANFAGDLTGAIPLPCDNPLFLIRIGPAFGAFAGRWLATGVEPRFDDSHGSSREYDDR